MKNQFKVATLAAVTILGAASLASATQFNLYGASAQADFWKAAMPAFVGTTAGCTTVGSVVTSAATANKHFFLHGSGCNTNVVPDGVLDMAVSGVASYEAGAAAGVASQYNDGGSCSDAHQRMMAQADGTLTCKTVHVGTTDLDATHIRQYSYGAVNGSMGQADGPQEFDRTAGLNMKVDNTASPKAGTTKQLATKLLVPFGLFVNNAVTAKTCTAGKLGDLCSANADCNSFGSTTDGVCGAASTIRNLSREQVAMIFSGQVTDWSDFGPAYTPQPIIACLRHAGSGTAAAFDITVMNGGYKGWGPTVAGFENANPGGASIYFNDATNTLIGCVNGNSSMTDTTGAAVGAIGYADADKGVPISGLPYGTSRVVGPIKYNGVAPTAANINNGLYDWFVLSQMYASNDYATQKAMASTLATQAVIPGSKAPFWTTTTLSNYFRGDTDYPAHK